MELERQEYWSGLPFPSPGDLPDLGIEPRSSIVQADDLPIDPPGKPTWFIENSTSELKLFKDWRVEWTCVFFGQVGCCNYTGFTVGMTSYTISRFTKARLPAVSKLCKTLLEHTVPFHEKRGQERVFCECRLPYLLLLWQGETVLSDDFPERSGKYPGF